jgi:hypothetical protein
MVDFEASKFVIIYSFTNTSKICVTPASRNYRIIPVVCSAESPLGTICLFFRLEMTEYVQYPGLADWRVRRPPHSIHIFPSPRGRSMEMCMANDFKLPVLTCRTVQVPSTRYTVLFLFPLEFLSACCFRIFGRHSTCIRSSVLTQSRTCISFEFYLHISLGRQIRPLF